MKKVVSMLLVLILIGSMFSGCSSSKNEVIQPGNAVVENELDSSEGKDNSSDAKDESGGITIIDEVSAVVTSEAKTVIGTLDSYKVEASFDSEAFPEGAKVKITLAKSDEFKAPDKERFELGTTGFDFTLEGAEYVRPDGPINVTFKIDEDMLANLEDEGFFQIAYYFDDNWYLQDVDEVDMLNGTASVALHHFSWLFPVKLTKSELRDQKAQEMAENKFNDENNLKNIAKKGQSDLQKVISEATGVTDTKALEAVAEYILNDKDFTSVILSGKKEDYTAFSTKVAEMMAKKMSSAAKIGSNATLIAGAFQAAGYVWGLDAKGAAESISNTLLDSSPYGKLLKLSITVTDESIKSWKKNGIEEMFQAYKNGADEGWLGYNLKKGDFDTALDQSDAIERQIKIDAVKRYCALYDKKEADLSTEKIADLKKEAINNLRENFKDRVEKEADIAEYKDYYKKLLDAFENNKVDDSITIKVDLMRDLTYEQRLESYERVTNKILDMVGKKINFGELLDESEIPMSVVTMALKKWYEEDGEAKVKEYLQEQGYLPAMDIEELYGGWSGTVTITKVDLDEALIETIRMDLPGESEDGCDLSGLEEIVLQFKELEGTTQSVTTTIVGKSSTSITMMSEGESMGDFTYDPINSTLRLINGTSSEEEFTSTMSFKVVDANTINGGGSFVSIGGEDEGVTYEEGLVKITFTMSMTKDN